MQELIVLKLNGVVILQNNTDKSPVEKECRNREVVSNIRSILEKRGLTQKDFSLLLGKKEAEISRWFSGRCNISPRSQALIEEALGEPVSSDSTYRGKSAPVRIGIVGTGNIAGRFVRESLSVPGVEVAAAYNPDVVKCQSFCEENGIPRAASSYAELLSAVDAVYVASPVDTHFQYAMEAVENGRHVLCEMPFTTKRTEAEELLKAAARRNLVVLPALKTAYCPSFSQMMVVAKSGIIGEAVDVSATVTNLLPDAVPVDFANERMLENLSYPLLAFFKIFGTGCRHVSSVVRREGSKALFTHSILEFDRASGSLKVGVGVKSEGSLVISGTRGYIYVPAPWWKPDYFEVRFENPAENKKYFFPYEADGLRYEIRVLSDKINHRDPREYVTREELLKMMDIQNKII